jgi:hypothetical protein
LHRLVAQADHDLVDRRDGMRGLYGVIAYARTSRHQQHHGGVPKEDMACYSITKRSISACAWICCGCQIDFGQELTAILKQQIEIWGSIAREVGIKPA